MGLIQFSLSRMVQVTARTSAYVIRPDDVWLLIFKEQSLYAGSVLRLGYDAL